MNMNNFHMLFYFTERTADAACQAVGLTVQPHAHAAWASESVSCTFYLLLNGRAKVVSQPCSEPRTFDSVLFSDLPHKVQNAQSIFFSGNAQIARYHRPEVLP